MWLVSLERWTLQRLSSSSLLTVALNFALLTHFCACREDTGAADQDEDAAARFARLERQMRRCRPHLRSHSVPVAAYARQALYRRQLLTCQPVIWACKHSWHSKQCAAQCMY